MTPALQDLAVRNLLARVQRRGLREHALDPLEVGNLATHVGEVQLLVSD